MVLTNRVTSLTKSSFEFQFFVLHNKYLNMKRCFINSLTDSTLATSNDIKMSSLTLFLLHAPSNSTFATFNVVKICSPFLYIVFDASNNIKTT